MNCFIFQNFFLKFRMEKHEEVPFFQGCLVHMVCKLNLCKRHKMYNKYLSKLWYLAIFWRIRYLMR